MPVIIYFGDDEYTRENAVNQLKKCTVHPNWEAFNFTQYSESNSPDALPKAFTTAFTPPIGKGNRLVWLSNTALLQKCSATNCERLEQLVNHLPLTTVLLLTCTKVDWRIKSSQLLKQHATVKEFALIPPWRTAERMKKARDAARAEGVQLSEEAVNELTAAVGNDTRALYAELEKLATYSFGLNRKLELNEVQQLLATDNSATSLALADAVRCGNVEQVMKELHDLLHRNEPPLKIVATLVTLFRTWAMAIVGK